MVAQLLVAILLHSATQSNLKPITLRVGDTVDVISYSVAPGTPINAKAADPTIVETKVNKTAKVSVKGLKPGTTTVKISGAKLSPKTTSSA